MRNLANIMAIRKLVASAPHEAFVSGILFSKYLFTTELPRFFSYEKPPTPQDTQKHTSSIGVEGT